MYMSLTADAVAKITDPKEKATAEAFLSLRQQYDSVTANILNEATATRQQRLDRLLRKIPETARQKLIAQVSAPSAQLSLANGVVVDPMGLIFDTLEASIPDLPEMLMTGAKLSTKPHPEGGEFTAAQAEEIVNMMMKSKTPVKAA